MRSMSLYTARILQKPALPSSLGFPPRRATPPLSRRDRRYSPSPGSSSFFPLGRTGFTNYNQPYVRGHEQGQDRPYTQPQPEDIQFSMNVPAFSGSRAAVLESQNFPLENFDYGFCTVQTLSLREIWTTFLPTCPALEPPLPES